MAAESPLLRRVRQSVVLASILLVAACNGTPKATVAEEESLPPVRARAGVDRAIATTGDVITFTVTVDHDSAFAIDMPERGAEIAGFRIIDVGSEDPTEDAGRVVVERWYQLRADLVGSYVLPPVRVRYWQLLDENGVVAEEPDEPEFVETSEIFVEVESVLPQDGEATDIRDIKPLRRPSSRFPWVWVIGSISLLLVAATAIALFRRRKRVVTPPPPAHEVAFEALDALREIDFDNPEEVRRFHFVISHVLREYVESRWDFNATDLTSEEILAGLDQVSGLDATQENALSHFLLDTDQVKFARHLPDEKEITATWERALGFVEATRPLESQDTSEVVS
jgi:hypothetical protein